MKAKLTNGQLDYFKQPEYILGDASSYATENGYMEVVYPTITNTQLLGNPKIKNGVITFEVTEKSVEQLTAEKLSEAKMMQDESIRNYQVKQVQETAQAFDDVSALKNSAIYPFWKIGEAVKDNDKRQDFNNANKLVLWKVIPGKAHTTQADWRPKDTPSLWVRVAYADEILAWVQPTGAHDAYKIGDKVKFNGLTYESVINANVYSPTAYPAGWKKL